MKSFITLIVAIAFALGGLFAYTSGDRESSSNHPSEKTEKASSKRSLLNYDFEFFSH